MLIFYLSLIEDDVGKLVFEKLYDQYKDDVLRLTYSLMKNHHDSEDMAQNTWIYEQSIFRILAYAMMQL